MFGKNSNEFVVSLNFKQLFFFRFFEFVEFLKCFRLKRFLNAEGSLVTPVSRFAKCDEL
jgi:hypothetical protein